MDVVGGGVFVKFGHFDEVDGAGRVGDLGDVFVGTFVDVQVGVEEIIDAVAETAELLGIGEGVGAGVDGDVLAAVGSGPMGGVIRGAAAEESAAVVGLEGIDPGDGLIGVSAAVGETALDELIVFGHVHPVGFFHAAEIGEAFDGFGVFAGAGESGEEDGHEEGEDGHDDEKFDEGEGAVTMGSGGVHGDRYTPENLLMQVNCKNILFAFICRLRILRKWEWKKRRTWGGGKKEMGGRELWERRL